MGRPTAKSWGLQSPLVSVLVPARNEEDVIGTCLEHLVAQDYPNLEIVVLDDGSTDATSLIVADQPDDRIRLATGSPPPPGWTGKNWACHQLAREARGDLLCFVDADTVIEPGAVSAAAGLLDDHDAGMVSLMPASGSTSVAGAVLLPMVTHALLGLFPLAAVHRAANPMVALAFGPFILITRRAYRASGGHAADPDHIVDDVQLSRNVKAAGYRVRIGNGTDIVRTRWYEGLGDVWRGFSKNAYGALGHNPWFASAVVFLLAPLLLTPFVRVGLGILGGDIPEVAVWQSLLLLANRALTSHLGRDPLWSTPLHPVTVAFWGAALAHSMMLYAARRSVAWKDRDVPTRPM
jgi:chlorobactene glucosyltransferase